MAQPHNLCGKGYQSLTDRLVPQCWVPDRENNLCLRMSPHYVSPVQQAGHVTHRAVVPRAEELGDFVFGGRFVSHGLPEDMGGLVSKLTYLYVYFLIKPHH